MGTKHEMVRRCEGVRELIDENKYTAALEEIDMMSLAEVPSISDLYLFAELYEKAERMDKKKQIYYAIYERTHSRRILYQLLRLVIRMGDLEEAKELFLAYQVVGGVTLDTYELRYRLARAEGKPTADLIHILEELKKEEYTEEWGYQLALLYELEGEREKCIRECNDLKLWFGTGAIVDKAVLLRERCEDKDWEPPHDEEIPEPVEVEPEPMEMAAAYAAAPVAVTELDETPQKTEQLQEKDIAEPEEPLDVKQEEKIEDKLEEKLVEKLEEVLETETVRETVTGTAAEGVSEPMTVPKTEQPEKLEVSGKKKAEKTLDAMLEEEVEDISDRGVQYHTLKHVIRRIKRDKKQAHFVFAGGEERITLAVAKRIAKELNNVGYFSAQNIAKITAEKLNGLNLEKQMEKLRGGCMLVTSAPDLTKDAVAQIRNMIRNNGDNVVVMLSGPFDEMDCFLSIYPELAGAISYKVRM